MTGALKSLLGVAVVAVHRQVEAAAAVDYHRTDVHARRDRRLG